MFIFPSEDVFEGELPKHRILHLLRLENRSNAIRHLAYSDTIQLNNA